MKETIFGIILGVLLVLSVFVGIEIQEKYQEINEHSYVIPTEFTVDLDGIKYKSNN